MKSVYDLANEFIKEMDDREGSEWPDNNHRFCQALAHFAERYYDHVSEGLLENGRLFTREDIKEAFVGGARSYMNCKNGVSTDGFDEWIKAYKPENKNNP